MDGGEEREEEEEDCKKKKKKKKLYALYVGYCGSNATLVGFFSSKKIMEKKKESFLVTAEESGQRMENVEKKKAKKGNAIRKRN